MLKEFEVELNFQFLEKSFNLIHPFMLVYWGWA